MHGKSALNRPDLTEVFPQIRPLDKCEIKPTLFSLKHDEVTICERLVKKHGEDQFTDMAKDIKINYLQWSKGQCKKYVQAWFIKEGKMKLEYKS